jgi:hypothetical protein
MKLIIRDVRQLVLAVLTSLLDSIPFNSPFSTGTLLSAVFASVISAVETLTESFRNLSSSSISLAKSNSS